MPWILFAVVTAANLAGAGFRVALALDPRVSGTVELNILRSMPSFEIAALVGALVLWRQPGHGAGRVLLGMGGAFAGLMVTEGYAHYVLLSGRDWPLAIACAWVAHWLWIPVFAGLGLLFLLLPTGRPPAGWWAALRWVVVGGAAGLILAFATKPGPLDEVYPPGVVNPLAVSGPASAALDWAGRIGGGAMLAGIGLCAVSLFFRYRRADALQRQQLRLVVLAGGLAGAFTVLQATVGQNPAIEPFTETGSDIAYALFFAAIGAAVLRYRLFDLDLVVNRTLVYAAVAAFITLAYVVIVLGLGGLLGAGRPENLTLSVITTVIVALGFAPVRDWARRRANRWVYGERQSPYELLRDFGAQLGGTVSAEELLPGIARSAVTGVGALAAEVRLTLPDGRERRSSWPTDIGAESVGGYLVDVMRGDEQLGQIAVMPRPGFPLNRTQRGLLSDLARQSVLALANLRLTVALADQLETVSAQAADLRASRQRLVTAQDDERRRLERDLHDGAQQQLVAATLGLRAVADQVSPDVAPLVEAIREQVTQTIGTLRELARGVFPPILADAGLPTALRTQLAKAGRPVRFEDGLPAGLRFDRAAEAALYFCCLEAVQNATKHAGDHATITVRLGPQGDEIRASVVDDGVGFDIEAVHGSGLINLSDRLAAVAGRLVISSSPGRGTEIVCWAPLNGSLAPSTAQALDVGPRMEQAG